MYVYPGEACVLLMALTASEFMVLKTVSWFCAGYVGFEVLVKSKPTTRTPFTYNMILFVGKA